MLVFGGVGSAVLAGERIGYVGIALAFGFSLLAAVYAVATCRAATSTRR